MSNFDFLQENWSFLLEDAQRAETFTLCDPRTASFYARRTLERALVWLFDHDLALRAPYAQTLAAKIHTPSFQHLIGRGLFQDVRYVHRLGNLAVHDAQAISSNEALEACRAIFRFTGWLVRVYTRGGIAPNAFNPKLLPIAQSGSAVPSTVVELQKVREELEKHAQADAVARSKQEQTEEELQELKELLVSLQAIKQDNQKHIPAKDYSEAQTRDVFIDVMLREAGWDPKGTNVEEFQVDGMPNAKGERVEIGYVDYVLWGSDGFPLAVVEAKNTKVDPKRGKRQGELYADCLANTYKQRPVIFYTNGYTTWLWDDGEYPPREVEGFYTRDELQWMVNRRHSKQRLIPIQPKREIAGRYYQMEACARVMEQFDTHRKRQALLVMATGTGKTRVSMSIVDMLLRAHWVRRVLFLADRIALVNQAKRAFNAHLPHVSVASLLEKTEEPARVVFSTYPTMLNLIDGSKKNGPDTFSVGHFDLIIIDEAHRSVYQKYGAIFEYFDSFLLGLTATPRDEVARDTYKLFELEKGQPTYAYELTQAVDDEFLVPPKAISVPLKFQREGIKYHELSDEEQEEYELQESFYDDETGQLKKEIGSAALNQWLFNEDTVDKVLMHLMENGLTIEGGDKLGKTIVFAKNSKHADFIVERFDANYPTYAGKFCQKIDFSVKYAQSLIDDFGLKNAFPQIAVSVDMLDTGIDIPEVLNLVFFKLVRSRTKFWQMVGRGTRLCPDLIAPGRDKKEFLIFDYCQNLEFFDNNPRGYDSPVREPVKQQIFKRRLEIAVVLQHAKLDDDALRQFESDLKDQMHGVVKELNLDNFIVRKQRATVEQFVERKQWEVLSDTDVKSVGEKLTGLSSLDDDHETARRFDLMVLNLQTALLQKSHRQTYYQNMIRDLAENLEDKQAIPAVAVHMGMILEIQTDSWWQDVTLPLLESVRINLRDLIQFVDAKTQVDDVFTDFEDSLIKEDEAEYQIVKTDSSLKGYRKRVEKIIRAHQDHLTIRRLKNNESVSEADIRALEDMLFAHGEGVPKEEYRGIYGEKPVGVLVRSIVGLNRHAAKQAFADFLEQAALHPDQISFLNEVVEFLVKNGVMDPKDMFDTPFTHYHDQGVAGVLGSELASKVVERVRAINRNADAA